MNNDREFKVGTIVKLKSGGPDMTVEEVCIHYATQKPDGDVRCQWFAGKKLERGVFPTASLELINPESKGE